MGQPFFQCQDIIYRHHVQVFSSNYSLYADMSKRVMKVLAQFSSAIEDEAFIDLSDRATDNLTELGCEKGIMCSKTFGRDITGLAELQEATATYTARAAEKVRSQETQATTLTVFVQTNRFNTSIPSYANSYTIPLPYPTTFTPALIQHALKSLHAIYREGYRYKKAGVYLTKIVPEEHIQPDLFGEYSLPNHYRQARLMYILDALNAIYDRDTLFFAVQGITRPWHMRQSKLSGHFTTR